MSDVANHLRYLAANTVFLAARPAMTEAADEIERLEFENCELRLDLAAEKSARQRAEAEGESLSKKVQRLSLRIISFWGGENGQ